jgi:hypothetical protein
MKPVPKTIVVNTGEQEKLTGIIDEFFEAAQSYVKEKLNKREPNYFQIKMGMLKYLPEIETDDNITYLKYKEFILAGVITNRTEFNHVQYTFFRKDLDEIIKFYTEGFSENSE